MDATVIVVVFLAFGLGALIAWLFACRVSAGAKQTVETLRLQLDEVVKERESNRQASQALAALRATQEERNNNYAERLAELKELEARVETKFQELAGKAVETAHDSFLRRAEEKLGATGKESAAKLETLLQPMKDTLKRYEEDLRKLETDRQGAYEGM